MKKKLKYQLGGLELKLQSYIQLKEKDIIESGDMVDVLGITQQRENTLLSKLAKKGILIRLTKGVYLTSMRLPSGAYSTLSDYKILSEFMQYIDSKYLISGQTAIYYYGFTTQIPNRIYVYNSKISGDKIIGGSFFVFMKTSTKRLKGAEFIVTNKGLKIPYASKARLLIDCIYDWNRYNTIPKVFNWIKNEIEKDPDITAKLASNAIRYGNKSVIARLGYCLELSNAERNSINRLQKKIAGSLSIIPLIPNTDLKGSVNKKWGLIINGKI